MNYITILRLIVGSIIISFSVLIYNGKIDASEEILKLKVHTAGFVEYAKFSINEKVSRCFKENIEAS